MQPVKMNTEGIDFIFGAYDGEAVDISSIDHTCSTTCRALWIGVGGDVKVTLQSGAALTFKNVSSGGWLEVRATKVWKVGTSATDIVAVV